MTVLVRTDCFTGRLQPGRGPVAFAEAVMLARTRISDSESAAAAALQVSAAPGDLDCGILPLRLAPMSVGGPTRNPIPSQKSS